MTDMLLYAKINNRIFFSNSIFEIRVYIGIVSIAVVNGIPIPIIEVLFSKCIFVHLYVCLQNYSIILWAGYMLLSGNEDKFTMNK